MKKERTAKLHQRSKALAGWEDFHWIAERVLLLLIGVEKEPQLIVWEEVRQLSDEE